MSSSRDLYSVLTIRSLHLTTSVTCPRLSSPPPPLSPIFYALSFFLFLLCLFLSPLLRSIVQQGILRTINVQKLYKNCWFADLSRNGEGSVFDSFVFSFLLLLMCDFSFAFFFFFWPRCQKMLLPCAIRHRYNATKLLPPRTLQS